LELTSFEFRTGSIVAGFFFSQGQTDQLEYFLLSINSGAQTHG
jgi:hypothetical protein